MVESARNAYRRALEEYKNQSKVKQHFRFMKDPKVTGPVYLKSPERVNALAYIFLFALLVYSIIQCRARMALTHEEKPMFLAGRKWSHGLRAEEYWSDFTR